MFVFSCDIMGWWLCCPVLTPCPFLLLQQPEGLGAVPHPYNTRPLHPGGGREGGGSRQILIFALYSVKCLSTCKEICSQPLTHHNRV